MKKIFLFLIALATTMYASAQVTVTFQVDVSRLIVEQGGNLAGNGMRIAGTFATRGATVTGPLTMMNWAPTDTASRMTVVSGNIWGVTVSFPDSVIGDSLFFKFVDGNWGVNEYNPSTDDTMNLEGCAYSSGSNSGNRIFVIPGSSGTYLWCYDHCTQCDGANPDLALGVLQVNKNVSVFSLLPNPAVNGQSTLMYSVSEYSPVNISLFNVLGQEVKNYVDVNRPAGIYNQTIDLTGLNTGVYFIRLTSGNQTITKRIVE